jgi:hypothetical protein
MSSLHDDIANLSDDRAISALALALQRRGQTVDPFAAPDTETNLREALHQPDVAGSVSVDPDATPGALARTALLHLADQDDALVARAISIGPHAERFDPITLSVGALVLMAFHADINLERDPDKGWTFHFRTKPLNDSTIGKLLGQLFGVFGNGEQPPAS